MDITHDLADLGPTEVGDPMPDLAARRPEVVRRLVERGVPVRTLRALLPDWDPIIVEATSSR